jgi:hypothetical protein
MNILEYFPVYKKSQIGVIIVVGILVIIVIFYLTVIVYNVKKIPREFYIVTEKTPQELESSIIPVQETNSKTKEPETEEIVELSKTENKIEENEAE